tara:strand:+ start:169 stop:378 length:210 start_codon:yes stop_codon:yes gene_type:complete
MKIEVNGELKRLDTQNQNISLSETLIQLGYQINTVIVELNSVIVKSDEWSNKNVEEGDKLEIVSIVGGG